MKQIRAGDIVTARLLVTDVKDRIVRITGAKSSEDADFTRLIANPCGWWIKREDVIEVEPRPLAAGDHVQKFGSSVGGVILATDGEYAWVKFQLRDQITTARAAWRESVRCDDLIRAES